MIIFSYIPIYGLSIAFKNYTVVEYDAFGGLGWL